MLHVKTPMCSITVEDLLKRLPDVLIGAEGEGDGSGTPPPSGEGSGTPAAISEGQPTNEPDTFPREYVETLRKENESRRHNEKELQSKLDAFNKQEEERKKAEMTEVDRLKAEAAETKAAAEAAHNELIAERKRNAIISAAAAHKFRDPEDALAYVSLDEIQMTDEGRPHKTSVESAVKKIAESKKYLIEGVGSADGGFRGNPPPPNDDKILKMKQDIANRGGVPVS